MKIKYKPMGAYATNCYIVTIEGKDLIIDAGVGAVDWVVENVTNPVAILNTHGHFDHVWSEAELKKRFDIPIYVPIQDAFMLENDPFEQGTPCVKADYLVEGDELLDIDGIKVQYRHFAGHTQGNSIIEIGDVWFCGDFLFQGSIGRWDFPYSSGADMIKSLQKAMKIEQDFKLYSGHGNPSRLSIEQKAFPQWIAYVKRDIGIMY
jgi:glyoxylase-like metal-dependent hydrolase (beta-lactamase superfamily II)